MSSCKQEVLKEIRDNITPDPKILKEALNIMNQFEKTKFNDMNFEIKTAESVYWDMKRQAEMEWLENQEVDVSPVGKTFVDFSFNGSSMMDSKLVTKAVYNRNTKETTVTLDNSYKFTFSNNTRISKPSSKGHYITLQNELYEYGIDTSSYGSSVDSNKIDSISKFTKLAYDIHKNVDKMKELLTTLNDLDNVKASEKHLTHLSSLFDAINPKFLKNVHYLLNTTGSKNVGLVEGSELKIVLKNSNRVATNEQSGAEIYAHEVVHTLMGFASKSKDPEALRLIRELYHVMNVARKSIKAKHLVGETSIDPAEELKIATSQLNHVFNNKDHNGLDEFIAHGLTNELWMKRLSEITINS